jgi:hypothetical protein
MIYEIKRLLGLYNEFISPFNPLNLPKSWFRIFFLYPQLFSPHALWNFL